MATLTGTLIKDTYDGLLKTTDNQALPLSGWEVIQDGLGNSSSLSLGQAGNGASIGGNLVVSGDYTSTSGSLTLSTGNINVSTGKVFVNGAGNNGYINSKGAVAVQVASIDNSRLFRGIDSSVQEVFYVQGTGDIYAKKNITSAAGSLITGYIGETTDIGVSALSDLVFGTVTASTITEKMRIDTAGNVGIGDTPDTLLHIKGSAPSFKIESSDTSGTLNIPAGSINFFGGYSDSIEIASIRSIDASSGGVAGQLAFYTSADPDTPTERMRIDNLGNVGIGTGATITSGFILETAGNIKSGGRLSLGRSGTNYDSIGYNVGFTGTSSNWNYIASDTASLLSFEAGGFVFRGAGSGTAGNAITMTERMRIDSSGKVGIGGSAGGDTKLDVYQSGADQTALRLRNTTNGAESRVRFQTLTTAGSAKYADIALLPDSEALVFRNPYTSERMRIDSSGNVGIGTTPSAWGSGWLGVDLGGSTAGNIGGIARTRLTANLYYNGTNNIYKGNYGGLVYYQDAVTSSHQWYTAPTGTAGTAATITERMRIDSAGNLMLQASGPSVNYYHTYAGGGYKLSKYGVGNKQFARSGGAADDTGALYINDEAAGWEKILFYTNNAGTSTERARITSGGYLKASNNGSYFSPSGNFHENASNTNDSAITFFSHNGTTSPYGISVRFSAASPNNTTNYFLACTDSTATRLVVYSNGNVVNFNNSYGAISDVKLKENITDATPKLDDLMQVQIRNFNYIGSDEKQLGVVAQELEEVFPAMISESPDTEEREVEQKDENGNIVYETEQVLIAEAVAEYTETIEHAEELDEEGNVITEAWTEEIVHPAKEAVYETVTTDRPVMTTERVDLGTTTKSVKYSVFVPILVKAMQEQQEMINELRAEIELLKQS